MAGFASIDQLVQPFHHQVFRRVALERDLLAVSTRTSSRLATITSNSPTAAV